MKFLVVLAVAVACAGAAEVYKSTDYEAPIVRSTYDINPDGNSFQYAFETGNGIAAQADGAVKNPNSDTPSIEVKGAYSYKAPDGTLVETTYIANEAGYQPVGSHIPPIPDAIVRSIAYNKAHAPPPESVYKP